MRVLVCGGRDYAFPAFVWGELAKLRAVHGEIIVIQGGAAGADYFAREWCFRSKPAVEMINVPADWKTHGKAAGPLRNQRMIDEHKPDLVLAFPGGRGTADMIKRAIAAGIEVREPAKHKEGLPHAD